MMVIFYLLLMLRVGRCTYDQRQLETRTVRVGDDVKLTCTRKSTGTLLWFRLVSGKLEALDRTFSFGSAYHHITAKEEPETFVLYISKAKLSDTAVYYCMKISRQNMFLKGTELKVEGFNTPGPEPDVTASPPLDPVHPEDSGTLRCSVHADSEKKTCPEDHNVCCFGAGSHQSYSRFHTTQENGVEEYENNPDGLATNRCFYSFFKNVSSSDAGTYYCAVATCGEIIFGNGSKLNIEADNMWDLQDTTVLCLCASLALSLIVIAFLIYTIKKLQKKSCGCCNNSVVLRTNPATASGAQQSQQADEEFLVYSAPTFTYRKSGKAGTNDPKTEEGRSIYSDVRSLDLDSQSKHSVCY